MAFYYIEVFGINLRITIQRDTLSQFTPWAQLKKWDTIYILSLLSS